MNQSKAENMDNTTDQPIGVDENNMDITNNQQVDTKGVELHLNGNEDNDVLLHEKQKVVDDMHEDTNNNEDVLLTQQNNENMSNENNNGDVMVYEDVMNKGDNEDVMNEDKGDVVDHEMDATDEYKNDIEHNGDNIIINEILAEESRGDFAAEDGMLNGADVLRNSRVTDQFEHEEEDVHVDAVSVSALSEDSGIQDTIRMDEDAFTLHQQRPMAWLSSADVPGHGPHQGYRGAGRQRAVTGDRVIEGHLQGQGQLPRSQGHHTNGQGHHTNSQGQSRGKPRLRAESKEAMYRQALTLMSERCATSQSIQRMGKQQIRDMRRTPIAATAKRQAAIFGPSTPQYFYVHQKKPSPMQPLKAWKGYHGNVYFDPISIKRADPTPPPSPSKPALESSSGPLREILSRGSHLHTSSRPRRQSHEQPRSPTRGAPTRTGQVIHLDKRAVLNGSNTHIQEDLLCVVGLESPGSLCVLPAEPERDTRTAAGRAGGGAASATASATKERICKGSVAHKVFTMKKRTFPLLSVSGDKFASPQRPSPLLQTQTTYSLSSQRLNMNSPDLMYGASYEKLPPLEQLRASLRHMDTAHPQQPHTPQPHGDHMLYQMSPSPLVKYSNHHHHQQNHMGAHPATSSAAGTAHQQQLRRSHTRVQ